MAPGSPRNPPKLWLQPGGVPRAGSSRAREMKPKGRRCLKGGEVRRQAAGSQRKRQLGGESANRGNLRFFEKWDVGQNKTPTEKAISSRLPFCVRGADGDMALIPIIAPVPSPPSRPPSTHTGLCVNHHYSLVEPSLHGLGGIPLITQGRKGRQDVPRKLKITI